jgi:uncharacterized protein (DUF2062 family)
LSFDDGPDPLVTPLVLDLLDEHSAKATFFVTGANAERHPDLIASILARGHSIGNHSYNHYPFLMLKSRAVIKREVESVQTLLKRFGILPLAFRPPVGISAPPLWRVMIELSMFCVTFSCRARDMGNRRIRNLASRILGKIRPGDIMLLHDVSPIGKDVDCLIGEFEKILAGLESRGIEIQPLAWLIGREVMEEWNSSPRVGAAETAGQKGSVPRTVILIPVYDHAGTVRAVAESCLREGYPVLVVDDGSTDGSLDRVSDLPVIRHRLPVNRGKGAAILAGAAIAASMGYDGLITIDADGQHDPADAKLILRAAAEAWPAIVLGARRMDGPNVPASSLFGRAFSNFWVRLECGKSLSDTQSGYRFYPLALFTRGGFLSRRYTFEIEAIVRGSWAKLPILSVPISVYYPPGDERISHFRKFRDNLRLTILHSFLLARSLLPIPHRRLFPETGEPEPQNPLRHPLRLLKRICGEYASPVELAASVWMGIVVGSLPIIPFATLAIIYIAHRLHLNKLAAVAASNICVFPFVPFLCVELGHFMLRGTWWSSFTRYTLVNEMPRRILEWLLGSLVLGPAIGTLGALCAFFLFRALRRR